MADDWEVSADIIDLCQRREERLAKLGYFGTYPAPSKTDRLITYDPPIRKDIFD